MEQNMQLDEALRIDGFDEETQHAFDKLAAYLSVFKNRANPASPRYITKLNDFQLKFMNFMDKAETQKAKFQIKTYISEIQNLLDKAEPVPAKKERINLGGGKMRTIKKVEREYANPNPNGGEYYDDTVHVYEAPAEEEEDEEVKAAINTLRRKGARVSRK
jgi:CRISPR/Cas system CSM-associated protein Csm3 (group 7 of RAMP superfamily)